MKCGHVGNAKDPYGNPICAICGSTEVEKECSGSIGLKGRKARCVYGDNEVKSKWSLPMFKYCPEEEYDEFYCGCYGWN